MQPDYQHLEMTYTPCAALVPVKALSEVKSRLATHLTLDQRESLVMDMLRHVLQVLKASNMLEHISVVSPDHRVLEAAQSWGAQALLEEMPGHNASLHAAALHEQAAGTAALLTIAADLPLLQASDIRAMIVQSARHPVVLAPSREGTGTNAVIVRPPLALPYLFGKNSLQRFQQAACQARLDSFLYHSIGLSLDIDTIDDLDDLSELQILSGERTHNWQPPLCNSAV
jgi:2-phospho-L-lactate guanylyltransferase